MRHQPDLAGQTRSVDGASVTIRTARMRPLTFAKSGATLAEAGASVKTSVARGTLLRKAKKMTNVKALFFDVFGTLVDWRGGIARESERILAPLGFRLDWPAFVDAWRGEYKPSMAEVQSGRIPFCKLDVLHRRNLERILPRFGIGSLPEATMHDLNRAWHRLPAWPEVPHALTRLRGRFLLAPVSNGNISLMTNLARHNGLVWDAILGAEIARDYKPKPRVYLAAAEALDLAPAECMMVAAHSYDLAAAADLGFRTAHVARPDEAGPGTGESAPSIPVDVAAGDLADLADRLGA
jgi:2-haloacid dehalogenase